MTYTITPFVTTRCLEQIRTDICYHDLPVTIVAVGAGLAYAGLGPSHHACEDIAFLRALPNMVVICPGDALEVRGALRAAMKQDNPSISAWGRRASRRFIKGPIAVSDRQGDPIVEGLRSACCRPATCSLRPLKPALLKKKGKSAGW